VALVQFGWFQKGLPESSRTVMQDHP